jgi:hypothetical protein
MDLCGQAINLLDIFFSLLIKLVLVILGLFTIVWLIMITEIFQKNKIGKNSIPKDDLDLGREEMYRDEPHPYSENTPNFGLVQELEQLKNKLEVTYNTKFQELEQLKNKLEVTYNTKFQELEQLKNKLEVTYNTKFQELEQLKNNLEDTWNTKFQELEQLKNEYIRPSEDDKKKSSQIETLIKSYNNLRGQTPINQEDISQFDPLVSRQYGKDVILETDPDEQRWLFWATSDNEDWYLVPNLTYQGCLEYHHYEKIKEIFTGCPEEFDSTLKINQFELVKPAYLKIEPSDHQSKKFTLLDNSKGQLEHRQSEQQKLLKKYRTQLKELYNQSNKGIPEDANKYTLEIVKEDSSQGAKRGKGESKDTILEIDTNKSELLLAVKYNDLDYWLLIPRFDTENDLNQNSYTTFKEMFTGCPEEWNKLRIKDFELVEPTLLKHIDTQTVDENEIKKFKVLNKGKLRLNYNEDT